MILASSADVNILGGVDMDCSKMLTQNLSQTYLFGVFHSCSIFHLLLHLSNQLTKAIWPFYPHWLYSLQLLFMNIFICVHQKFWK